MNSQDILKEMEELRERLDSLEKLYDSLTSPNKRWRANKGGFYYCISDDYWDLVETDREDNSVIDDLRYIIGNYFETRKEAEFEVKRLKVISELKEWTTPINDFDWNNMDVQKYFISLKLDKIMINSFSTYQVSDLVFASREAAKKAIETIGENRIIKYYFRRGEKNADSD